MRLGHIEKRTALLKTLSPVFIGSGDELIKKEYMYYPKQKKAVIPDLPKLYNFMERNGLAGNYLEYLKKQDSEDLLSFLRKQGVSDKDITSFALYEIDAGDAVVEKKSRKGINMFIKGADGMPYIPGSSLKGAIRTALLSYYLNSLPEAVKEYHTKKVWDSFINVEPRKKTNITKSLDKCAQKLEGEMFGKLGLNSERPYDAVNDFMKGLSVGDSRPLPVNSLVLCQKVDMSKKGRPKPIPLFRECIKPGLSIGFEITIDRNIANKVGLAFEIIEKALGSFSKIYDDCFSSAFTFIEKFENIKISKGYPLYLGGGAGFVSKTVVYPLMGKLEGLNFVSSLLDKFFDAKHMHKKDVETGVSPHMMKCTLYEGKYWHMGKCSLEFLD